MLSLKPVSFFVKVLKFFGVKVKKSSRRKKGELDSAKKEIEKRLTDHLNGGRRRRDSFSKTASTSPKRSFGKKNPESDHGEEETREKSRSKRGLERSESSPRRERPPRREETRVKRVEDESKKEVLHDATVISRDIPREVSEDFKALSPSKKLLEVLKESKIYEPTEVQKRSIPVILSGENLLCVSQTGSGKTLAFVLPAFNLLLEKKISQVLIVCPTREIAFQINGVIESFRKVSSFSSALLIGGEDYQSQKENLRRHPEIIVATPGRLVDMINQGFVWLEYTEIIILDEADRMMDMGFEKELNRIMDELKNRKQVLLFTATLMDGVKKIIKKYVKHCEEVIVGNTMSAAENVTHSIIKVQTIKEKDVLLEEILKETKGKIIVFFNRIEDVKKKYSFFDKKGIKNIVSLHSGKNQDERKQAIERFSHGNKRIIFATDIISRGLDVPNVELVVNYDLPTQSEEYIHRIGRTGRAGLKGEAKSFCLAKDIKNLKGIERILGKTITVEKQGKKNKEINQSGE